MQLKWLKLPLLSFSKQITMNLQKFSIGARLRGGFLLIILTLLVISVVGYVELERVSKDAQVIVKDRLVKVALAHEIENEINRQARALRTALIADDDTVVAHELEKVEKSVPVISQALKRLEEIEYSAEGKTSLARIAAARQQFRTHEAKILELIQKGKTAKAQDYLVSHMIEAQTEYLDSVEELVSIQKKAIDYFAKDAQDSAEMGEKTILTMTALALACALLVSALTTRSIVMPLERLQMGMKAVEKSSDFSQRIQVTGSDEVGQASLAFNQMLAVQQGALQQVNAAVGAMAAGDFNHTVTADLHGDLLTMKQAINQSVQSMKMTMVAINDAMQALSQGRFDVVINAQVEGEFKTTLNQADQAVQMLRTMMGDVGHVMAGVAQGRLNGRVVANGQGDLDQLKTHLNKSLETLAQTVRSISNNAQLVASASSETTTAVDQLSDNAETQRVAISQVATALKMTADSVSDVTRNTAIASENSQRSMRALQDGMQKMADMVQVVARIAANSQKINGISNVIEKIAYKTNLLSINAAIEAAHAGEHGKGFGVVADEVGALATSSATSSQEITELVRQAVEEARVAVINVQEVSQEMQLIEADAKATNDTLQRIAAALEEQTSAIEEITVNVGSMERVALSNANAAEEMAHTASELNKIANETRSEVSRFTT
jgi:methyl-accepting chemotaxis protein